MQDTVKHFDVVVVGHGIAGLSAAVTAMQQGARVAVLERAPFDQSGGCTRYTEAYLRMKSEDALADDFEDIMAECGGAHTDVNIVRGLSNDYAQRSGMERAASITDPEFISNFAAEVLPAIQWLKGMGVRFYPSTLPHVTLRHTLPLLLPSGGGLAMMEALMASARQGGVQFFYETTARELVVENGVVTGVDATGKGNAPVRFQAASVVLASGGFEGSHELMSRYLGPGAINIRPVALGCHFNKGDGIRMAVDAGAARSGDYNRYHATPIDQRSARTEAKVLIFPYGIVVNREGRRFVDEAPGGGYDTFDRMCWAIQGQTDGIGYALFDAKIHDIDDFERAVLTDKPPIMANTLEEMAATLDIPVGNLRRTVDSFNAACQPGHFDPIAPQGDGLGAHDAVPPKSHWARPLDQGPYMAYPLISSSIITFGGIKTDPLARVLNADGERIPGLFAAGALVGVFYRRYAAATSVLRGLAFGRIAGRGATEHLEKAERRAPLAETAQA